MKAAFYVKHGPAREVLSVGEQPTPSPGAGEVRVRLRTSGVNPSDVKGRAGVSGRPIGFPVIVPHSDGAGDIDAVGAGVPDGRIGERVWLWNGQWRRAQGTAAQYIVVPADQAVPLPQGVDYAAGACLGIPALTAYQAVQLTGTSAGGTVLITGGAGAVAHYAIQMAKIRGLRVLTTISSEAKAAHAKAAGADETINYRTDDVGARVRALTNGAGADAIIELDVAANAALLETSLKPHGTAVIYGYSQPTVPMPVRGLLYNSQTLRFFIVYDLLREDRDAAVRGLTSLLQAGRLIHAVAETYPLDQIAEAHEAVERGALGNVVVEIP